MENQSNLIFLSYSRSDSEFALELSEKLRKAGANIWMDQAEIKPSMHWDNTIEEALQSCQTMIVLLSERSVASENVKDEYSYAIENGKRVLPVLLETCEIPFRLKRLQYTDFSQDPKKGLTDLLESLKTDRSKSATVLKAPVNKPRTASQQAVEKARKKSKAAYFISAAFLVVVVVMAVFWKTIFPSNDPGTFTVMVLPASEVEEGNIPDNGRVILEGNGQRMEEQINGEGIVTFRDVPAVLFKEDAGIKLSFSDPGNEPYRSVYSDSTFMLQRGGSISIPVKLYGLERVTGIVKDFESGDPLTGARISVNGEDTFSDQNGEFDLSLPDEKQKKFQTVRAYLEGYQMFELRDVPVQTGMELPILMKPKAG